MPCFPDAILQYCIYQIRFQKEKKLGHPTIYPTGVTLYNPAMCWNGYTIFQAQELGAVLMDMNGAEINVWRGVHGFPNKILPGGDIITTRGRRSGKFGIQDGLDIVQLDWDGKPVWVFDHTELVEDPDMPAKWMARSHHDHQREGNPVGYYAPHLEPKTKDAKSLILCHRNAHDSRISDKKLLDELILIVDWNGEKLWEWRAADHFDEFGFREGPLNTMCRNPNFRPTQPEGQGDWLHMNAVSWLGPNKWFDGGDKRFHPENIIASSRETNIIFIIDHESGKIVWKLGPDYDTSPELRDLGWIIGQHHAHMIPKGLPGEGHILVFDNGGWAGYDVPNPGSPTGIKAALRDYSRVLEIDPTTLAIIWQYTPKEAGFLEPMDSNRFYSPFISSAQRLPNGNTLITEGSDGRIFEVTRDHMIVWEYISPYWGKYVPMNMIYRAYRVPYEWIPQVEKPKETPIAPADITSFRMPGAAAFGTRAKECKVGGCTPFEGSNALCVASANDEK